MATSTINKVITFFPRYKQKRQVHYSKLGLRIEMPCKQPKNINTSLYTYSYA